MIVITNVHRSVWQIDAQTVIVKKRMYHKIRESGIHSRGHVKIHHKDPSEILIVNILSGGHGYGHPKGISPI